jgi:GT2 family glycosyltransferase
VTELGWLEAFASFISTPPSERAAVAGGPVIPEYENPPPKWLDPHRDTLDRGKIMKRVPARGGAWGCNIAYRRSAVLQVGMFCTRLGREGRALGAHEETELNLRLEMAGYEVWWLPAACIRHHIAAERLRLRWRLESAFAAGRSRAVVRLFHLSPSVWRYAWVTARLLAVPFQIAFEIAVAPVITFHRRGQTAAKVLLHAADTAGLGWGLLTELCHRRTRS